MIQLILGGPHHFYEIHFFRNFSKDARFSGNFKLSICNTFSRIFFTYLFSISNQLLINIYYLHYWFLKKEEGVMLKIFLHFSEYTCKIQKSLYAPTNYSNTFTSKSYSTKISFERRGIFDIVVRNQNRHKNVQ